MTKAQITALMLASAAAGVAIPKLGDAISGANAAPSYAHAVDLRRDSADGGVRVLAYGHQGAKDIGQAKSCKPTQKNAELLSACMNVAATDCEW